MLDQTLSPGILLLGFKFPCPMATNKHEVSKCVEFAPSPLDRWEQIDKGRMCFSCLKPKTIYKSRKCTSYGNVPKVLKWAVCASWVESKGLAHRGTWIF